MGIRYPIWSTATTESDLLWDHSDPLYCFWNQIFAYLLQETLESNNAFEKITDILKKNKHLYKPI